MIIKKEKELINNALIDEFTKDIVGEFVDNHKCKYKELVLKI